MIHVNLAQQTTSPELSFRVRDYFSQGDYKLLTTMPSSEFLEKMKSLDHDYYKKSINLISMLYSYVTERNYVEDTPTFFLHVACAAAYELHTNTKIKDKDHIGKALHTLRAIENFINKYSDYCPTLEADLEIVNQVEGLLSQHAQIIKSTLNLVRERDPVRWNELVQHYRCDDDEGKHIALSEVDADINTKLIHNETTPKKTPKKLSNHSKESIGTIISVRQKLQFDEVPFNHPDVIQSTPSFFIQYTPFEIPSQKTVDSIHLSNEAASEEDGFFSDISSDSLSFGY